MLSHFKSYSIKVNDKLFLLDRPRVMGILNTTNDSFYDGSKYHTIDSALYRVETMINEGADIIDIGGQSSRPGADMIGPDEELKRTVPVVEAVKKRFPDTPVSIDTFRAVVARANIEAGAGIINDISAGEDDAEMLHTVAKLCVPYIAMHKQGQPKTMQINPQYEDVTHTILDYFRDKIKLFQSHGLTDLIIDPGFGFGKTLTHNYTLMGELELFHELDYPLLIGVSRKSMVCKLLKVDPKDALNGSTVLHTVALLKGAHILRVHDVKEAVQAIRIVEQFRMPGH